MPDTYLYITIEQRTRRVTSTGLTSTLLTIAPPGYLNLVDEIASWLYIALTGHNHYEHPHTASLIYANAARAHIQAKQHVKPGWRIAQEVVNQWGTHIQPWLGCVIQQNGQVVEDAKEYRLIYDLITGREIPPVAQGFIWIGERE